MHTINEMHWLHSVDQRWIRSGAGPEIFCVSIFCICVLYFALCNFCASYMFDSLRTVVAAYSGPKTDES